MKFKADKFARGFLHGFKRVNIKKTKEDCSDEGAFYVGGYFLGFAVKIAVVLGAAHYGIALPA